MQDPNEMWQAEVKGEVYDATFAELTVWITENSLLETDRVRKGRLRWLEAGKVPSLRDFFNAKELGIDPPHINITTNADNISFETEKFEQVVSTTNISVNNFTSNITEAQNPPNNIVSHTINDFCDLHPEIPTTFVCETCFHTFCNDCPERFGTNVRTCPYCGALCKEKYQFETEQFSEFQYRKDISEGFGLSDFGKALTYPFNFKSSLFFGGLFVAIFGIGQLAAGIGNIFLIVGALFCFMFANAIYFGVLANTIENFSQGFTDRNFMPGFDDFSIWDDVLHPFFLSIAVYISSFGLMILLFLALVWFAWDAITSQMKASTEATLTVSESENAKKHVEDLLNKYKKQNEGRTEVQVGEDGLTEGQRNTLNEEAEFQKLNDLATNYKKQQAEAIIGKTPEQIQNEQAEMGLALIKSLGIFFILIPFAFLWGAFYFPAACAVAGYTRSFIATINPLIGLDTIKRLGIDYWKVFGMSVLLWILSGVASFILGLLLTPFSLPMFGNIPAQFLSSFLLFYVTVVFSVILGFALYKNSDKLNLLRG